MRRLFVIVLMLLAATGAQAQQQTRMPQPGDPPVLARITLAPPAADGTVTITGSNGAVFANAFLSVRNLYSGTLVYAQATSTGSFTARIVGTDNTPFWISPSATRIPPEAQNLPGSLPGGPGVIVYSLVPTSLPYQPITQIAIDGDLSDWHAYPVADVVRFDAGTRAVYALRNADSLYVAFSGTYVNNTYAKLELRVTIDISTYTITLDPRQAAPADLARVNPAARDLGALIVAARQVSGIEVRVPLTFVDHPSHVSLDGVRWLDAAGVQISRDAINADIPQRDEHDGIFRPVHLPNPTLFSVAGAIAQDDASWSATARTDALALQPGAAWHVQMDVSFGATNLPADAQMIGQIALQPIARSVDGQMRLVGGVSTDNGWSSILTPSGLAIDNLDSSSPLGEAVAEPFQLERGADATLFPLDFSVVLPDNLPSGLYVPFFEGFTRSGDGGRATWDVSGSPPTRLPLVINVGGVDNVHLLWTLFADDPSDGSRGILPAEDQGDAALSNRVRFDSPTYILPPFQPDTQTPYTYPLEPYLLDELPNSYTTSGAPLIPFQFPGGQLEAAVTRPDGTVDDLGSAGIVQNQLSTPAQDEQALFGTESPVDEFRLATLNPKFSAYSFDQYGEYQITLTGSLQDLFGNHYEGGGTYTVLAAEPLDLTPGVLPGTPFEVSNPLNFGLHLSPGVPADVTVTVRVYPLDGSAMIEQTVSGTANSDGYFQPDNPPFVFSTPGEYVIDYEARYTGADQRLWAASLRGAGVIGTPNSSLVAHGERGLPGVGSDVRPAWFSLPQVAQATGAPTDPVTLNFPYHSGDVEWINDGSDSSIRPVIRVQDLNLNLDGAFSTWLTNAQPNYTSDSGLTLPQLADQGELPVTMIGADGSPALHPDQPASDSYTYVSAVRPNVTVRQFVSGGDDGGLTLNWDQDDPLNRQIGAGSGGNRPGDVIFLFGGAVVRAGSLRDSAIYGALAVVTSGDTPRIYPPDRGAAGGADGGPLLTLDGQPVDMFMDMTGAQPGERLTVGDPVAVAGQVAPLLPASVTTTFTAPSGRMTTFTGRANAVGAYFDPATRFTVDEPGVWTVGVHVQEDGLTSAGQVEPPLPEGSVLGAHDEQFSIYVLPSDATPLSWNPLLSDTIIPIVSPYNFSFTLPNDWTHIQVYHTLSTPGYIIEDGPLHVNGRSFSYQYSVPLQSRVFPNLENDGRSGLYVGDVSTLTFVATGIDASGATQIRSRTFTLMHDRLISTE